VSVQWLTPQFANLCNELGGFFFLMRWCILLQHHLQQHPAVGAGYGERLCVLLQCNGQGELANLLREGMVAFRAVTALERLH
jgi:hypothetical protein